MRSGQKGVLISQGAYPCPSSSARQELAKEILAQFGELKIKATGSSMLPSILPGDVLTFQAGLAADEHLGKVVATFTNGRLVAHRLRRLMPDGCVTRGDALSNDDPAVAQVDMLGFLIRHERNGRLQATPGGMISGLRPRLTGWLVNHSRICRLLFLRWNYSRDTAAA